jgi:sulfoxide reductase catalytic subunit YedY
MLIKPPADIPSSEITSKSVYVNRRQFIQTAAGTAVAAAGILAGEAPAFAQAAPHKKKFEGTKKSDLSTTEPANNWTQITTYNNYYEFGIDKDDPSRNAKNFKTEPWSVSIEGECMKGGVRHFEDILKGRTLEDRIYRHRCVEAWSMVIPWVGFSLGDFVKECQPTSKAKYVEFTTLFDPGQMPGQRAPVLKWPYVEGLRMDEAMNPLAILAVGLYGEQLPNQDGAPIRLVVPWKYGFKSIKSIVKIRFVEKQPINSWQLSAPTEYGFYANVNPTVNHPRWSQANETRLPSFFKNRKTEMFNGYGAQVASMYEGMDLRRNF